MDISGSDGSGNALTVRNGNVDIDGSVDISGDLLLPHFSVDDAAGGVTDVRSDFGNSIHAFCTSDGECLMDFTPNGVPDYGVRLRVKNRSGVVADATSDIEWNCRNFTVYGAIEAYDVVSSEINVNGSSVTGAGNVNGYLNFNNGETNANGVLQVRSSGTGKALDGASFMPAGDSNHILNFLNTNGHIRAMILGNGSNSLSIIK
jgi:hypothetical protein